MGTDRSETSIIASNYDLDLGQVTTSGLVLIVDDDPAIRASAQHALATAGIDTITAQHGFEALQVLASVRPDGLLLDLNMPVLDGYGVLRMLRKRHDAVPVLLMTADPDGQRLGPDDGVIGHVPKPFTPDALVGAVTRLLRLSGADSAVGWMSVTPDATV